jgi:hypothetical protein
VWRHLDEPAFECDGNPWSHADILAVGILEGSWTDLRARAVRHRDPPPPADGEALEADVERFRRERRLGAASDYLRWLDERGLQSADARRYLAWHRAETDHPPVTQPGPEPDPQTVGLEWWAEAVLAGDFGRWFATLVSWLATGSAVDAAGSDPSDMAAAARQVWLDTGPAGQEAPSLGRLENLAQLRRRSTSWSNTAVPDSDLAACVEANRLDWTHLCYDEWPFGTESAAWEARLCVTVDGEMPASIGRRTGSAPQRTSGRCQDLDPAAVSRLASLSPGEVVVLGPSLLQLVGRHTPQLSDPEVAGLARRQVAAGLVERWASGRVKQVGSW